MKEKNIILILFVVLAIFVTGCTYGSYSIKIGSVDMEKDEINGSYSEFNGFKERKYDFSESSSVSFNTNIKTESGQLKILILDENENIIHEIDKSGVSSIEIKEPYEYTIRVEGIDHKGNFSVKIEAK